MTRLKTPDLEGIVEKLGEYDDMLRVRTGRTLKGVACDAVGIAQGDCCELIRPFTIGVVPIKSGEGMIRGFVETVRAVVAHLGFNAFVTETSDVAGTAEAVRAGADILMMADDLRFVALNIKRGLMVDNGIATAKGFVAALDLMCGGISGREVLVLGCGFVGRWAAKFALERGGRVSLYDHDPEIAGSAKRELDEAVRFEPSLEEALGGHHLIIEATNGHSVIDEEFIGAQTYIVAPGMPLGLTGAAQARIAERLVHDPLQTGVAVMAIEAAAMSEEPGS